MTFEDIQRQAIQAQAAFLAENRTLDTFTTPEQLADWIHRNNPRRQWEDEDDDDGATKDMEGPGGASVVADQGG